MKLRISKDNRKIKYLYHYTKKEYVESILKDQEIKTKTGYTFFTDSLEHSIELFEDEMMSNNWHFDENLQLVRRVPAHKEDYRIIKIKYTNDDNFVRFPDLHGIYDRSVIHSGNLKFDRAEIINFPNESKVNYFKIIPKPVIAALVAGVIFPLSVSADSWLDEGNYDTSWYAECTKYKCIVDTPEKLAGFAKLVNVDGIKTFKKIQVGGVGEGSETWDLTEHDWETIISNKNISFGFCGLHTFILKYGEGYIDNFNNISYLGYGKPVILYRNIITTIDNDDGVISTDKNKTEKGETVTITVTPSENKKLSSIKVRDTLHNKYLSYTKVDDNTFTFVTDNGHYEVSASFEDTALSVDYELDTGIKIDNPITSTSLNDIFEVPLVLAENYEIKNIDVINAEYELNESILEIKNVTGDVIISIETLSIPVEEKENEKVEDKTDYKNPNTTDYIIITIICFILAINIFIISRKKEKDY